MSSTFASRLPLSGSATLCGSALETVLLACGHRLDDEEFLRRADQLAPVERERILKVTSREAAQASLLGWEVLTELVAKTAPGLKLARSVREQPIAINDVGSRSTIGLSLSHSNGMVAVCVWEGGAAGIDIQSLRTVSPKLADRICLPFELDWVHQAPSSEQQLSRVIQLWTLKEAYLKALGLGLAGGMNSVGFEIDSQGIVLQERGLVPRSETRVDPGRNRGSARWHLESQCLEQGLWWSICLELPCS